jgi:hypothetical protein
LRERRLCTGEHGVEGFLTTHRADRRNWTSAWTISCRHPCPPHRVRGESDGFVHASLLWGRSPLQRRAHETGGLGVEYAPTPILSEAAPEQEETARHPGGRRAVSSSWAAPGRVPGSRARRPSAVTGGRVAGVDSPLPSRPRSRRRGWRCWCGRPRPTPARRFCSCDSGERHGEHGRPPERFARYQGPPTLTSGCGRLRELHVSLPSPVGRAPTSPLIRLTSGP